MQKIALILKESIKGIFHNKVTAIIILLFMIIPSIFVGITLEFNWEVVDVNRPIKLAVVNLDEGGTIHNKQQNIGDRILEIINYDESINWEFVDYNEARVGVLTGEYYGMIVIPENFTNKIVTFTKETPVLPTIDYSMNIRHNASIPMFQQSNNITLQTSALQTVVLATQKAIEEVMGEIDLDAFNQENLVRNLITSIVELDNKREYYLEKILEYKGLAADMMITLSNLQVRIPDLSLYVSSILKINDKVEKLLNNLDALEKEYVDEDAKIYKEKIEGHLEQIQILAYYINEDIMYLQDILGDTQDVIKGVYSVFNQADQAVVNITKDLKSLSNKLSFLIKDENINNLVYMLRNYPELVADYLTVPTLIKNKNIIDVDDYISLIAPYSITIAMWLGGILLITMLNVRIKSLNEALQDITLEQEYIGKLLFFIILGMVQASLLFIQVRWIYDLYVERVGLFFIMFLIGEVVFITIMYGFIRVFGNFGKYLNYYFLVLQMILLGDIFPLQVIPTALQKSNESHPFVYVINCLREIQLGILDNDLLFNLSKIILYIVLGVIFGLLGVRFLEPRLQYIKQLFIDSNLSKDDC